MVVSVEMLSTLFLGRCLDSKERGIFGLHWGLWYPPLFLVGNVAASWLMSPPLCFLTWPPGNLCAVLCASWGCERTVCGVAIHLHLRYTVPFSLWEPVLWHASFLWKYLIQKWTKVSCSYKSPNISCFLKFCSNGKISVGPQILWPHKHLDGDFLS